MDLHRMTPAELRATRKKLLANKTPSGRQLRKKYVEAIDLWLAKKARKRKHG